MEEDWMVMDRKNEYDENGDSGEGNLQIEWDGDEGRNEFVERIGKKQFKVDMEGKKRGDGEVNGKGKEERWRDESR